MRKLLQSQIDFHKSVVPWPATQHVEQDLLLCLAIHAIFTHPFLAENVAMRGGTVLHKVHLLPPARYSEDIDLVATSKQPKERIERAIKDALKDVFGRPKKSMLDQVMLAIRNATQKSEILRMTFLVPAVSFKGNITIKIEVNLTEVESHRPKVAKKFEFPFDEDTLSCSIKSFDIHEMLGTKMRALFQRNAGRDLFDLHHALVTAPAIDPKTLVESFIYYMGREKSLITRPMYEERLRTRLADKGFCSDMNALIRSGLTYDPKHAGEHVRTKVLALLPGEHPEDVKAPAKKRRKKPR